MASYSLNLDSITPSVNPIGAPGNDYEHIEARPEAFGALTARALGNFGEAVEKTSNAGFNVAEQQQEMQDKTHAAELHSWASDQWSSNSGQFLSLEGRAAVSGLADYKQKNRQILDDAASQAADPYTKQLIQQQSRRVMDVHNDMAERYAAGQEKVYQRKTAELNEASSGNQAVLFATNGEAGLAKQFLFHADQEVRNQAELQGYEGKAIDQLVSQKRGQYVMQIVEGLARKEGPGYGPKAALDFYHSEREKIDAGSATRIESFLHNDLTKIGAEKIGEDNWKRATEGLTSRAASVRNDATTALADKGIPLRVTSEYRSPEHNAAVGGARSSQHLEGKAIDVSLTGLTPDQQKTVVDQFLTDPRVGGFGYYPNSNSIHVDVRQGGRAAWGTDYHGTSVGEGWPAWMTQQVRAWQGGGGATALPAGEAPQPASLPSEAATPAFATAPRSALPLAVAPTWHEKEAVAIANIMSDPELRDRPQLRDASIAYVKRMAEVEHAATIDDTAAQKAQEKALKMASDATELQVMQDVYSPHPKISASQMLALPDDKLSREAKERLLKFYPVNEDRESDLKKYGPGFFDAFKAIHAEAGDPARITDPAQLYNMVGPRGSLTMAGLDKLAQEIYKPKNPESEAETKMKSTFLDNAKRDISGEHDLGFIKLRDPKGEEIFLHYLGYFFPAYDEGRKKGKTPAQLLDPESPDYLGKALNTMKRPMSVWMQDMQKDNQELDAAQKGATAAPAPAPPAKFDPVEVNNITDLRNAYLAGQINRATATQLAIDRGWAARKPAAPPAQPEIHVPISQ